MQIFSFTCIQGQATVATLKAQQGNDEYWYFAPVLQRTDGTTVSKIYFSLSERGDKLSWILDEDAAQDKLHWVEGDNCGPGKDR